MTGYDLMTESGEYHYDTLDNLYSDMHRRFEPLAEIRIFEFAGDGYTDAPSPKAVFYHGKNAWLTLIYSGLIKDAPRTNFEQDYMDMAASALGNRFND